MTQTRGSRSALNVAFARTHLTWLGVVDDPYARQMLPPNGKRAAAALQLPGLRRLGRRQTLPGLAARTLFFDRFIDDALDDGIRQVVILAAGYDSRAWEDGTPAGTRPAEPRCSHTVGRRSYREECGRPRPECRPPR
jgi:O-methyltransferase involved in polyketide biosynthesis